MSCRWGRTRGNTRREQLGSMAARSMWQMRMHIVSLPWTAGNLFGSLAASVVFASRVDLRMVTLYTYGEVHPEFKERLNEFVRSADPESVLEVEPVPLCLAETIVNWDGQSDPIDAILRVVSDTSQIRLLCAVDSDSILARWSIANLPHAVWGCVHAGLLAVEYAPAPSALVTQLHEALHCLGVNDCYDEATLMPKESCLDEECLMRYGATGLTACERVTLQLRSASKRAGEH